MPYSPPLHQADGAAAALGEVRGRTLAAFLAAVVFAGGNAVAIRIGMAELAPYWGAAVRFLSAAILLFAYVAVVRMALPRGRSLAGAALYGLLNFGFAFGFVYLALAEITAGTMMVVLATVPLLTLFFASAGRLERLSLRGLAGAIVALFGIGLVFHDSLERASAVAMLAALAAAVCMALATVSVKAFPRVDPVVENAIGMAVGGVLLFGVSVFLAEPWVWPTAAASWLALTYLVLIGSIAVFLLYLFVLRRTTASAAAYILLLAPLAAVPLGAWLLDEPLHPTFLIGGAFVLVGVYVGLVAHTAKAG